MKEQIEQWLSATCEWFSNPYITIDKKLLLGRSRDEWVVAARNVAMYLIYNIHEKMSYEKVGIIFDNRNHSTVMHGVNNIDIGHVNKVMALAETKKQEEMAI
jgi:chromosomal replication initiation ATPase DnaA